jgi:hypothetical protein
MRFMAQLSLTQLEKATRNPRLGPVIPISGKCEGFGVSAKSGWAGVVQPSFLLSGRSWVPFSSAVFTSDTPDLVGGKCQRENH